MKRAAVPGAAGFYAAGFYADDMTDLDVRLRAVRDEDVRVFYEQQLDPAATEMAAFPSRDWPEFERHWHRIRQIDSNVTRTILVDGEVAGNVQSFVQDERRFVGYWLGQSHWGQGVATRALGHFLRAVRSRPVFAQVVEHNLGSRRVLEKNGFRLIGRQRAEDDVSELLFQLGESPAAPKSTPAPGEAADGAPPEEEDEGSAASEVNGGRTL